MLSDVSQFTGDSSKKSLAIYFQVEFQARDCSKKACNSYPYHKWEKIIKENQEEQGALSYLFCSIQKITQMNNNENIKHFSALTIHKDFPGRILF